MVILSHRRLNIYIYPKMSECITWVYLNVRRPSKCPFKWVKFPEPIGSRCSQGPGFSTWLWVKFSYAAMRRVFWWFQVPKSWPGCWFQTFLIFHNTWGVIRNPLTNSIIFQDGYCTTNQWPLLISSFLNLSPPRTQFWNLLSSHSMSAFSLVHGQCLAVQLTILPEQSCLGCWYALDMCLVGGLEHGFYSPIIYGIILPPLTFIFFRGVGIPPTRCRL
jgi:hypothetical protein